MEAYNAEMKDEIAVTRRATYKAEEDVTLLEKGKRKQDLYIDGLNEQIKALQESLAVHEAQLAGQRAETGTARGTLLEAEREMAKIGFEKSQLLAQWKSSLIGMQRRDEALTATHVALRAHRDSEQSVVSEISGYKVSIGRAQVEHATLSDALAKQQNEAKFLEAQLAVIARTREGLAERYAMLKRSLEQTDKESQRLGVEQANIREQIAVCEQNRQTVDRERQELEANIAANQSTQTTVEKAAANLHKAAKKVVVFVHAKELEKSTLENEMARIRVDALNTAAHAEALRASLGELVAGLKEKDRLIEKYEMEIRQRNDEIEKKMYIVDRLNRKCVPRRVAALVLLVGGGGGGGGGGGSGGGGVCVPGANRARRVVAGMKR